MQKRTGLFVLCLLIIVGVSVFVWQPPQALTISTEDRIPHSEMEVALNPLPRPPMASTPWDIAASSIKGEQ